MPLLFCCHASLFLVRCSTPPSPAQDGALRGGSLLESSSIASSISGATAAAWPQDAAVSGGYEGDGVVVVRVAVSSPRSSVSGVHACAGAAG